MHFLLPLIPVPNKRQVLQEALFLSGFCLFLLLVFQPFGTYEYQHVNKALQLAGYSVLTLVLYPVVRQLSLQFVVNKEYYHLGQEALLHLGNLLVICLAAFFYHALVIQQQLNWGHLAAFLFNGLTVGLLPFGLMLYNRWLRYGKRAAATSVFVEENRRQQEAPEELAIRGENKAENYRFLTHDILFLKASGNYVEICFLTNGKLKTELIRNTLSKVKQQLPVEVFSVIHRSYLANVRQFDKLVKEEGGYKLQSTAYSIRLPVSRQQVPVLEEKLKDYR